MTAAKLDPATKNGDIGLYWGKCRRVDPLGTILPGSPFIIGELATGLSSTTAGTAVVQNDETGELSVVPFEAGEWKPISYHRVLAGATIDGRAESTTTTGMFWTTSPTNLGKS